MAGVNVCSSCPPSGDGGNGTSHGAPELFRRVYHTGRLGPVAWLCAHLSICQILVYWKLTSWAPNTAVRTTNAAAVPSVPAAQAIPLFRNSPDLELRADAALFMAQKLNTKVPAPAGTTLNERSIYQRAVRGPVAGVGASIGQLQLVMLLRCTTIPFEWASVCNIFMSDGASRAAASAHAHRYSAAAQGLACNWSMPQPTNIPDAHTRTHAGTLPDGRTYLLGTQVSNTSVRHRRDPLTLSLSSDGIAFDRVWALRWGAPERRFKGLDKDYGFAYPGATVSGSSLFVAYSVNKEDIEVLEVPLELLA